jgi:hypothetical protein
MSRSIQVVIAPGAQGTRVLATEGSQRTLLKAHLTPSTSHPRALPFLLEALALWEGAQARAVLAVDEWDASCATTLYRDVFADSGTLLYTLEWVPVTRARRRRTAALHLGRFGDLERIARTGGTW